MRLRDRAAVITGSSMGIGEAIAWAYAREGARVVINSRSQERGESVARALRGEGHDAIAVAGDVRDTSTADRLAAAAQQRWNRFDVLVNNAGTSMIGPSEVLPEEGWRLTIDTNLT